MKDKVRNIFNKSNIVKYSIVLIAVILVLVSSSLAYFTWGSTTNTNTAFTVVEEDIKIYYDGGPDIEGIDLYPTSDKSGGIKKDITVKVDKARDNTIFNLYLDLNTLPASLRNSSFKYAVYNGSTLINSGSFSETGSSCSTNSTNHIVLLNGINPSVELTTYSLYIWIDGNMDNPTEMMNQDFEFYLHADGVGATLSK